MFAALHVVIGEKAGVLLSCATCLGSVVKVIVLEPIAVRCFRAPATVLQGASSNAVLQGASYSAVLQCARLPAMERERERERERDRQRERER